MITIMIAFILNVIDYNHDYKVYNTNLNVILHQYLFSYVYNTDINMLLFTCCFARTRGTLWYVLD